VVHRLPGHAQGALPCSYVAGRFCGIGQVYASALIGVHDRQPAHPLCLNEGSLHPGSQLRFSVVVNLGGGMCFTDCVSLTAGLSGASIRLPFIAGACAVSDPKPCLLDCAGGVLA